MDSLLGKILELEAITRAIGFEMELVKHETCLEYFRRRLSEGWKCISLEGYNAVLLSPDGIRRELDLRNDVETLRPNAPGDECTIPLQVGAACPNHYQNVDDVDPDEDDTVVICSGTGWFRDLYNVAASGVGAGVINYIKVYTRCRADESPDWASLRIAIKSGTGGGDPDTVDESGDLTVTESYENYSNQWNTNPATAAAWAWAEIDKLQIGLVITRPGVAKATVCTQVFVEVDYTPEAGLGKKSANMAAKMIAGKLI